VSALIASDIHLNDAQRERYRWGLIPWLEKEADRRNVAEVIFLGDYTDAKDHHASILVNQFVQQIRLLSARHLVVLLLGNHDYFDPAWPFFQFLNSSKGVSFIDKACTIKLTIGRSRFYPSSRSFVDDVAGSAAELSGCQWAFTHQTYNGSKAENGALLPGVPPSVFAGFKGRVISGDIHVPQVVSRTPHIEYCGAPYKVHFGDSFTPRVLFIHDDGRIKDLHFPCPSKEVVKWVGRKPDLQIMPAKGDLVKIEVQLKREDYPEWQAIRYEVGTFAAHQGWVVCGLELKAMAMLRNTVTNQTQRADPEALVRSFVKTQRAASGLADLGCELLKEVSGG